MCSSDLLLLVAAREIFHHLLDTRRLDAQCAHVFIGVPLTVPAPDEAVVAHLVVGGEHSVSVHEQTQHKTVAFPVCLRIGGLDLCRRDEAVCTGGIYARQLERCHDTAHG